MITTRALESVRSVLDFRPIERDRVARRLRRAVSVDDLRTIARRRLPRGVFDYVDGAAEGEHTLAANRAAFERLTFRPRVLRQVGEVDTSTTLLGRPLPLPLVLAPTGFTRIVDSEGELAVARAAARAGVPYVLSTLSTRSIEEVGTASQGTKWFQVYAWRDRGMVREMLERARASGYEAIVVTVDTPVLGRRERDIRRGFTLPPKIGLATLLDGAVHPAWTWRLVRSKPIKFANVVGHGGVDGTSAVSLAEYINAQFDRNLSWSDVDWFREHWDGPVVLKGVQTVADSVIAARAGVDAVALSNHGGRQLDSAPAIADLLAPVAQAVAGELEIICDGGVRRGSDVVKAVALGARACMIGRAYLWGLGAAGERGVDHVLDLLGSDVRRTMALVGAGDVAALSAELIESRYP